MPRKNLKDKEQIEKRAEALYVQMMTIVQEEDNLSQAKRSIFDEQAEISAILKEKKYL